MTFLKKYYHWFPLLLLCGFYAFRAVDFPIHDFANYYFGGQFLAEGNFGKWVYFPYEFNKTIFDLGHKGVFVSYAPNTPFLALLFAPLSFVPAVAAKIIFNVISCGLFFFSLKRLTDFYSINPLYLLAIPFLFFVPIKNEILFGQVYMLLFFLLTEGWLAYQKNQLWKMAILLSFAIMLKIFPVFLILIFLFRKEFRAFAYVMISTSVLFAVSLPFTGLDIWFFYLTAVFPKASNGEIATAFVDNYQSVFMFLKRLLVYNYPENTDPLWGNHPLVFSALVAAFKIKLIAIGYYISKKSTDSLLDIAYWLFAALLMSPYGSTYSFLLLVFLMLFIAKSDWPVLRKITAMALLFLVSNLLMDLFINQPFPVSYLRLLLLVSLTAILIFSVFRTVNWKIVSVAAILAMIPALFSEQPGSHPHGFYFNGPAPILLYDYTLDNNKLTYSYWDDDGQQSRSESLDFSTAAPLEIRAGEVYYNNKKITSDGSNKLKPMLIDQHTILYLSDFDRGIGFYTLKKIDLD